MTLERIPHGRNHHRPAPSQNVGSEPRLRTFCGSDSGGHRAAVMFSLIETCKLSDVDPKA